MVENDRPEPKIGSKQVMDPMQERFRRAAQWAKTGAIKPPVLGFSRALDARWIPAQVGRRDQQSGKR